MWYIILYKLWYIILYKLYKCCLILNTITVLVHETTHSFQRRSEDATVVMQLVELPTASWYIMGPEITGDEALKWCFFFFMRSWRTRIQWLVLIWVLFLEHHSSEYWILFHSRYHYCYKKERWYEPIVGILWDTTGH